MNATSSYSFQANTYCALFNESNATQCLTTATTNYGIPLSNLFSLNGIIPLVLVAAVFVALVIGAIALVNKGKKN